MQVAQVRQNTSMRGKVTGWWEENGSGCRGHLGQGSLLHATWPCFGLALHSFTKQLGLILVSPHALKNSSETQDDGGHQWLSRWHSPFWVRAEQTQQHDAGGQCCWTRCNEIRNTDSPTLLLYKAVCSVILIRLQLEIYILQTKVTLAVLLQMTLFIMFSLKIYTAILNHHCISVWRWLQLCTELSKSHLLFAECWGPVKGERSYTRLEIMNSINKHNKLMGKSEFVIIFMMMRLQKRKKKKRTITFHPWNLPWSRSDIKNAIVLAVSKEQIRWGLLFSFFHSSGHHYYKWVASPPRSQLSKSYQRAEDGEEGRTHKEEQVLQIEQISHKFSDTFDLGFWRLGLAKKG